MSIRPSVRPSTPLSVLVMGGFFSRKVNRFLLRKHRRLLIVGLDGAGKTTILFRMYAKKMVNTKPTESYNVQSFQFSGLTMNVWDVGGQEDLRRFWRHYYTGTQGIIFVIDACDIGRMKDAKAELMGLAADPQLHSAAILVLVNKQDQPGAMAPEEMARAMDLGVTLKNRKWKVQGSTGTTGDGLKEGFTWLGRNCKGL